MEEDIHAEERGGQCQTFLSCSQSSESMPRSNRPEVTYSQPIKAQITKYKGKGNLSLHTNQERGQGLSDLGVC